MVESLLDTDVSDDLICVTKQVTEADVLLKIKIHKSLCYLQKTILYLLLLLFIITG